MSKAARYVTVATAAMGLVVVYAYLVLRCDFWLLREQYIYLHMAVMAAAIVFLAIKLGQDKPQRAMLVIVGLVCGVIAWMLGLFLMMVAAAPS